VSTKTVGNSLLREVHAAEEGLEAGGRSAVDLGDLLLHLGDLAVDTVQVEAEARRAKGQGGAGRLGYLMVNLTMRLHRQFRRVKSSA
jgi:hypothetical protein